MHRVRTSLPFFRDYGYDPLVLALDPSDSHVLQDVRLEATVPSDIRVWRVRSTSTRAARMLGVRNAALRAVPQLASMGARVIADENIALVYFSTTAFPVMTLGRYWRARFGVPYVLDFQDLWLNDYYARMHVRPPGGRLKYGAAHTLARVLEPATLRAASHVISVSPAYPAVLRRRYAWLRPDQFTVLPFGAPVRDFEMLRNSRDKQNVFDPTDGCEHWVYVGRGGDDMQRSLESLFLALRRARDEQPTRFGRVRLHFIGTDYAEAGRGRKTVEPVAAACGVSDLVEERTARVPYFDALRCLADAHMLLAIGSDDSRYTASKLFPYVLAAKPLLAIFHERSSVVDVLRRTHAGTLVTFVDGEPAATIADRVVDAAFRRPLEAPATDWRAFDAYTAREMTRRQCAVFDGVIGEVG